MKLTELLLYLISCLMSEEEEGSSSPPHQEVWKQ